MKYAIVSIKRRLNMKINGYQTLLKGKNMSLNLLSKDLRLSISYLSCFDKTPGTAREISIQKIPRAEEMF